jgi:hypothetical protein
VNRLEYAFGEDPALVMETPLTQQSVVDGRLTITFNRVVANTDLTLTVQGADSLAGPWTDLAASVAGTAMTPFPGGATVIESGTGATRTVEVRDLYLTSDPLHPARFLRVHVTWQ